jgi:hypothetical protein
MLLVPLADQIRPLFVNFVLDLKSDRLSETERAMLMGGACAKAYGWSPKTG